MPTQVQTPLLAPYVAAAARQVIDGRPLTARSIWALELAKAQLENSRDAINGVGHGELSDGRAALVAASGGSSLELATLALSVRAGPPVPVSVEGHEEWASAALGELAASIDSVLDRQDQASAKSVQEVFDAIVEQLSGTEFDDAPY